MQKKLYSILSYFVAYRRAFWALHHIFLHVGVAIVHCISFSALEENSLGHFIMFPCTIGHCLTCSLLQRQPGGQLFMFPRKYGHPCLEGISSHLFPFINLQLGHVFTFRHCNCTLEDTFIKFYLPPGRCWMFFGHGQSPLPPRPPVPGCITFNDLRGMYMSLWFYCVNLSVIKHKQVTQFIL